MLREADMYSQSLWSWMIISQTISSWSESVLLNTTVIVWNCEQYSTGLQIFILYAYNSCTAHLSSTYPCSPLNVETPPSHQLTHLNYVAAFKQLLGSLHWHVKIPKMNPSVLSSMLYYFGACWWNCFRDNGTLDTDQIHGMESLLYKGCVSTVQCSIILYYCLPHPGMANFIISPNFISLTCLISNEFYFGMWTHTPKVPC